MGARVQKKYGVVLRVLQISKHPPHVKRAGGRVIVVVHTVTQASLFENIAVVGPCWVREVDLGASSFSSHDAFREETEGASARQGLNSRHSFILWDTQK